MPIDPETVGAAVTPLQALPIDHCVQSALQQVCVSAVGAFGVRGAGLMMLDSALRDVAASDEPARLLEQAQAETGEGPCVETLVLDRIVTTDDLHTDTRWPRLAERMRGTPVRAALGVPAHAGGGAVGSLDVYHDHVHEWDPSEVDALPAFNGVVEAVLASALLAELRETIVEQLQYALDHRVTIERAVGVIMGRERIDPVAAFTVLRNEARAKRRKVVDLAAELLTETSAPLER
jgi:GAF domain-containing protein